MKPIFKKGILWTWLLCFPLAALFVTFYRFPIPFSTYESGIASSWKAILSIFFYTLMGGFIAIFLFGMLAGIIGEKLGKEDYDLQLKWCFISSFIFASVSLLLLSTLDMIIGPW